MPGGSSMNRTEQIGGYKPERMHGTKHPLFQWPPRPSHIVKFMFGFPGYFWPWPCLFLGVAAMWWHLLPDVRVMRHFSLDWIMPLFLENMLLVVLFTGTLQIRLYRQRAQGPEYKYNSRWLAIN